MPVNINKHLFTETGTDCNALNVLGTLVHRFPDVGDYLVSVTRNGSPVGERLIVVSEENHSRQASVDLSTIDSGINSNSRDCSCEAEEVQCIRPDGYGVFHVSSGPGGYSTVINPLAERDVQEFDSEELTEYDRFAVVLMRPGTYVMRNLLTDDTGTVDVAYPNPDTERPDDPVTVTCSENGFDPAAVDLVPAQGLVFDIETSSHVQVELKEPHERATEEPNPSSGNRRIRPVSRIQSQLDPGELTVEELKKELDATNRENVLRGFLSKELANKGRKGAIEAIKARIHTVSSSEG